VPRAAILLQAGLAISLLWIVGGKSMDRLVTGVVFIDWIFHILAVCGLFLARRHLKHVGETPKFLTPLWPLTPLIFIIGGGTAMIATFWNPDVRQASIFGVAWIAVGVVVYALTKRQRTN
jgi:APA family basic amino acid/polyamine antiporter